MQLSLLNQRPDKLYAGQVLTIHGDDKVTAAGGLLHIAGIYPSHVSYVYWLNNQEYRTSAADIRSQTYKVSPRGIALVYAKKVIWA